MPDKKHEYHAYGAIAELLELCMSEEGPPREILLDGPAGTGKSRGVGEMIVWAMDRWPGARVCVLRKTLASLRESWQVTFEEKILWHDHPVVANGPTRAHRSFYEWHNGSRLVLGGMDIATRLFSTEFDIIYVNEATELTKNEWESLHRALRNSVIPWQLLIGDCNPDAFHHWLNQRCNKGMCHRLQSRHWDNPSLTKEYLARLESNLSGVRKERLWFGRWVNAEGMIYPIFDTAVHLISGKLEREKLGPDTQYYLTVNKWGEGPTDKDGERIPIRYFVASMDFGFRAPGCLQVWAVDAEDRMFRTAEVYQMERNLQWWAQRAAELRAQMPFEHLICDSAEPRSIDDMNDILRKLGEPGVARGADKSQGKLHGFNTVRLALQPDRKDPTRGGRLYLLRDVLYMGRQPELDQMEVPCCTEEELPSYVHKEVEEGQKEKEESDPDCADHGCDALRYMAVWKWGRDLSPVKKKRRFARGTLGAMLGHDDIVGGRR